MPFFKKKIQRTFLGCFQENLGQPNSKNSQTFKQPIQRFAHKWNIRVFKWFAKPYDSHRGIVSTAHTNAHTHIFLQWPDHLGWGFIAAWLNSSWLWQLVAINTKNLKPLHNTPFVSRGRKMNQQCWHFCRWSYHSALKTIWGFSPLHYPSHHTIRTVSLN